jgi:hypothetical protein
MGTPVWEIIVPATSNEGSDFLLEHHQKWDAYVRSIAGGVTIMKSSTGYWLNQTGKLYVEKIIPCRIICTYDQIMDIVRFTAKHYHQEAITCFQMAEGSFIFHTANDTDNN